MAFPFAEHPLPDGYSLFNGGASVSVTGERRKSIDTTIEQLEILGEFVEESAYLVGKSAIPEGNVPAAIEYLLCANKLEIRNGTGFAGVIYLWTEHLSKLAPENYKFKGPIVACDLKMTEYLTRVLVRPDGLEVGLAADGVKEVKLIPKVVNYDNVIDAVFQVRVEEETEDKKKKRKAAEADPYGGRWKRSALARLDKEDGPSADKNEE